jgi:hypothetical protein
MPSTYEPIATTTVSGSSTSSVNFTSLSSAYTDIVAVVNWSQSSGDLYLRVNGTTGSSTDYSETWIRGNGTNVQSARLSNRDGWYVDYNGVALSSIQANAIINFQNYANTTTYKTVLWRENDASSSTEAHVGLYRSTSAITQINFLSTGGNLIAGSTFTLYGIKAA